MDALERTEWYSCRTSPERAGYYEVIRHFMNGSISHDVELVYFDGMKWDWASSASHKSIVLRQDFWRGITFESARKSFYGKICKSMQL